MKIVKSFFLLFIIFSFSPLSAMKYEFYFYVKNNAGEARARDIIIYRYDNVSKSYLELARGTSRTYWPDNDGPNATCNIIEVTPRDSTANILPDIHWYNTYIVRVANKFVTLTYGGGTDAAFEYNIDTDSLYVSNTYWNITYHAGQWNDKSILLKNNFSGGNMYINDSLYSNIETNGITELREATTFPHIITAVNNQQPGNYKMLWYHWNDNIDSLNRRLSSIQNFTQRADFKKEFKITFRNYYGSAGNTGGVIKVRGGQVSSPSTNNLDTEYVAISAEAVTQTINSVELSLDYWSDNLGTSASINPTPTDHKTYTAYLKGKPVNTYRNLWFNTYEEGQPVEVHWTAHGSVKNLV